ncbi:MAG: lamin tail domain-containing protein, partial [Verrucomicrobiales bacterium]
SYSGTLAAAPTTVNEPAHGLATGDTITIEGYGGISDYNGSWEVTVIHTNAFTIDTPFLDNHSTPGNWAAGRPFALSASRGEDLWLLETDGAGQPSRFIDRVEFAAAFNGETLGRWPDGGGTGTLVSMTSNTLGSTNLGAQVGPVIISEIMYHPDTPSEDDLEYVELCNTGSGAENLANWRLRGGADFDFTAAHSLPAGGVLVIVSFDPITEPIAAMNFRTTYGIDVSIPLAGPFLDGPLDNITGTVRLQRPDSPPLGDPEFYPQVTEDEVTYQNIAPWPTSPAGGGASLNRAGIDLFGNFATSWSGEVPTPGGKRSDYETWSEIFFGPGNPAGSGPGDDFDGDEIPNSVEFALGMNPLEADSELLPPLIIEGDNATLTYDHNLLLDGITTRVDYSTDLISWFPAAETVISTINFAETRKASVPTPPGGRLFMRLTVEN